ncbi:MAG TPA: alpha/beta hydrolase-fold protein [Anaerolineales bacterium]|nr:alpha/beta hydrolase-fold protein [Anaerolineales bacterium]
MNMIGALERHETFPSRFVLPRHVDVWCPPGYFENTSESYPVIYMNDGQNIYDSAAAFGGSGWEIHKAISGLMDVKEIRGAIVVGIWNTDIRWREYMPQKPYWSLALRRHHEAFINRSGGEPVSDAYLQFLVEEMKPFIDSNYRTFPDQANTFVMGSSMGGLISLYAVSEYPNVFGGAGCLSTNWPAGEHALVSEMAKNLPDPDTHKLYFDYGTEGLDALYGPYQKQMDEYLRSTGYMENRNWMTIKFAGADHSETAWRARVKIPLSFLLA